MATVSDILRINTLALRFAAAEIRMTPSQVVTLAEGSIIESMLEVAKDKHVDDPGLNRFDADTKRQLDEQLASWANVFDADKYGLGWNDRQSGWVALAWGISELVQDDAGSQQLRWK
ncbi:hypothetical protein PlfCFBP13513_14970 [Plantibacter flavus]|uniref:hypothetical protein n=1 Tax=Plantibacter TaxID=190323 RepID=UPI0010C22821|nr:MULTISPECIES: hypothetical protein [Plantibacter]MBD8103797.1 hypothetical protein [Plantibacter sp. CFBP 8775]MBD8467246.1 hypothetical protein [Plantibacter sp. CFBP 8798]TKJ96724.1 hypothetical protein PlfCFBP13513_14970 [Plantibacter flavus]